MLTKIARFEARYVLRNPMLWVMVSAVFALFIVGMSVDGFDLGNEGGLLKNASYAILRNYVVLSVLFMLVTTAFVAGSVLRDDETGFGPIIRSTGITRLEYVLGRFGGAWLAAALCMLVIPLGTVIGTNMPWAPPAQVGPNRLGDHLYGYVLVGLPNLFIHGAILFALATITRSMMATYLAVVGFVAGFFMLQEGSPGAKAVALAEPFAGKALKDAVRYWTVAERNVQLPEVAGTLLQNRILWIGIAVAALALAAALFRFADQGMTRREKKLRKLVEVPVADADPSPRTVALPAPEHSARGLRALLWMRTRFEVRQVVFSFALPVVLAWGLFTTAYSLSSRDPIGRPSFPTTLTLIPHIEEAFAVVLLVIAIFYAGELVWRERDRRVHEIIDATPMPNWAYVVPKTLAMALVLGAVVLVNIGAAMVFQLASGYQDVEAGRYITWYLLPATWDVLLLAAAAIAVQAVVPHKIVGWTVMVGFIVWQQINTIIDHNLLNYGSSPKMPLSDMNGADSFWQGAWTVRVYWGAFAVLLLLGAHLLWRRGTELRLRPRLASAGRRLRGDARAVALGALAVFITTGAFAYYNMNVLNEYRTPLANLAHQAEFEKKYWKYHDLPQPTIAHMTVAIDLFPEERRAVTRGRYLLRNLTADTIHEVHLRQLYDDFDIVAAAIPDARLVVDDADFDYRIFRLDSPMPPGDERVLTFETLRWHRGFRNGSPNPRLVENGTFLAHHELTPAIGMSREGTLEDATARRKFGLPPRGGRAPVEDSSATARATSIGGWTTTDITVSTTASQTPLAPGRRIADSVSGSRRIARFVSEVPVREVFSIQSARYAEKRRRHSGVELAVYYHPKHSWNVDRMLDALAASLDYYQSAFGPYPFDHARIVEFPGYANFAQAFAGTVPYSETYGFIADFRDPRTIDHVTATTAHELAHQYWAHQVTGADMQGSMLLSETLANYSALMMLKKLRSEDEFRRALRYTLDRYLGWRSAGLGREPPLIRVDSESWIAYQKGALAMHLVQERLGEDAVNRALRTLLARYRFKHAPYPRSTDLVDALRAEARTEEDQRLITDLFERVLLYDLKVTDATSTPRTDGKWDVTVTVAAKQFEPGADGLDAERPFAERIEVGLFAAEAGQDPLDSKNVILMERQPVRSGTQVLRFVTDRRPTHVGIDPYNHYIDRNANDNVRALSAAD